MNEDEEMEISNCDQEDLVVNNSAEQERPVRKRTVRTSAARAANRISEYADPGGCRRYINVPVYLAQHFSACA